MDDSQLILQTLRGDRRAFDELVRRYQDALYRHLLRQCGSREEAEDLCQEAFIRLYQGLRHFQRGRPVAPYLFRIATNLHRDRLAAKALPTAPLDEAEVAAGDLSEQALVRLEQQQIAQACTRLRPEYREAISLYYDQGLSYREIALATGVPLGTVSTRLARGLASLREMLAAPARAGMPAVLAVPMVGWEQWLQGRLAGALQGQAGAPTTLGPAVSGSVAGSLPAGLSLTGKITLAWQGGTMMAKLGMVGVGLAAVALVGAAGLGVAQTMAARGPAAEATVQVPEDVADIPVADLRANGDARMRYLLNGPRRGVAKPARGYKLAIIMPGGDGSAEFRWFVTRVYKYALGPDWIAAQPVAVKWTPSQQIVWPTRLAKVPSQGFSTEEFVEAVVADLGKRLPVDKSNIVTLSWSSSGPAAYAISLQGKKSVTGSFVAMSVYYPATMPPVANAKGHRYYLLHSPDDQICRFSFAQQAQAELAKAGAQVNFAQYPGGHGWRGPVYPMIKTGMTWLTRP